LAAPDATGTRTRRLARTASGTLEYAVSGQGGPTLVLINGAGVSLEGWRRLYPGLERLGTVFACNRFGIGRSDPPRGRLSGGAIVAALRQSLGDAGLAPPYVLVGHSLGGLYANLFARVHPAEVAGCVLVEATHPADHQRLREHEGQLLHALGKLFSLPQRLLRANVHAELASVADTVREIDEAGSFPDVPLCVVTGGRPPPRWLMSSAAAQVRRRHQEELARLSPQGRQVVAPRSGHFPQLSEPQAVVDAIAGVVRVATQRSPGPAS
jgi:pimeloyl-ACP methyl ester carboxylesterase